MDFIHIDDNIHNLDDDDSDQVEDIGFIENNKLYNSRFHDRQTQNSQNTQNKRVYPTAQKILPTNGFAVGDDNKKVSKKVTYDDILSSLNMKVINGKLQIVRGDADVVPPPQKKQVINNRQKFNENVNMNAYSKQNEFYNKFLQAQTQAQVVADPLTPEEKKRLLMIQYIKHQQERQRISRIKSRKLSFV